VAQNIIFKVGDGMAQLTLSRPDMGNKITLPMLVEIQSFISDTSQKPDVRVVVIKAEGNVFCLGRDSTGESRSGLTALESRERFMRPVLQVYAAIRQSAVPVVALVSGHARGFGCALAGACDITLAAESAVFSLPEIEDGIPPLLAMSSLHTRIHRKALDHLVYTAQVITSQHALSIGLVSQVYTDATFAQKSNALLVQLVARPRHILSAVRLFSASVQSRDANQIDEHASSLLAITRSK
jgi:enoyl-CoA hydratase/carnithine racemase